MIGRDVLVNMKGAGVKLTGQGDKLFVHLTTPEAISLARHLLPPTRRVVTRRGETWVYADPERKPGVN